MFGGNLNYEETFAINNLQVSGVNSFRGSLTVPQASVNILGIGHTFPIVNAPPRGGVNFSRYFIGSDVFLSYTGDGEKMAGGLTYNSGAATYDTFSFENGYLNQHSISCALGRIPQTSTSVSVFGDIGGDVVYNLIGEEVEVDSDVASDPLLAEVDVPVMIEIGNTTPHPAIQIPNQGSIEITCDGASSNRVTAFEYAIEVPRIPIYALGNKFPLEVHTQYPIRINSSFVLDVDDYSAFTLKEYLVRPKEKDISIVLKDSVTKDTIETYSIANARLISQEMSSNADTPLAINLRYEGYINKN